MCFAPMFFRYYDRPIGQTRFRLIETPGHRSDNNSSPMWRIVYTLHPRWISREDLRHRAWCSLRACGCSTNTDEITQRYAIMILHEFTLCHVTLYYLVNTRSNCIVFILLIWRRKIICIYQVKLEFASRIPLIRIAFSKYYTFVTILWQFYIRFCSVTIPIVLAS